METKIYEKGSYGWVREQQKIKAKKAGFDNVDDWSKHKNDIKNIYIIKKIIEENNIDIKDTEIFYRFWEKVDIKDNINDCWNWVASIRVDGYGHFLLDTNKKKIEHFSHRVAYLLTKGNIPEKLQVQHLCNNRRCCNPSHLELGDQSKNLQYMIECDRSSYGENNGQSKLKEDQVREIHISYNEQRKLHPRWKQFQITEPIAKKFGVSKSTISLILSGRNWPYIWKEFHQK